MRPTAGGRRRRRGGEGEVEVFVADEQAAEPVEPARWSRLAAEVLAAEGVEGNAELSVLFVSEEVISDLNRQFMGVDGPTDVLSFPIDDDAFETVRWPDPSTTGPARPPSHHDDAPLLLGDVVICPAVAARNAPSHAGSYDDELALLVVHGVLHILGMDHADPAEAEAMRAREAELLTRFHGEVAAGTEIPATPPADTEPAPEAGTPAPPEP
jgi:probable rRNA maturation factor